VVKNYLAADATAKTVYLSLVAAAFIFVLMLLLTGAHP
jgi:hypothetical protein